MTTTAPSFKQMQKDGTVKRADARKMRFQDLHVEPGFNLRAPLAKLSEAERAAAQADDESLYQHIVSGGKFPPLEVRPRAEGGAWIVEGHRRLKQIGRAIDAGVPLQDPKDGHVWIDVEPFEGNDADRNYRVMTSQNNRKLLPMEWAEGYKRARGYGHDVERMAEKSGQSVEFVRRMLALGDANSDVQQMVQAGDVSATQAVKLVRQHGEGAGKVLADALQTAKEQGKTKVTAAVLKPKALPPKVVGALESAASGLAAQLPVETLARMNLADKCGPESVAQDMVLVPAATLHALWSAHKQAQAVREPVVDKAEAE